MPLTPEALSALRQEYSMKSLRRADLDADPIRQFQRWLTEAHERQILEPNAMVLATVDSAGQPWTRTVLLKGCDDRGFTFFTNYEGAKAQHIESSPRAALTFWWGPLERQINITGTVSKTSREESEKYFHSRPLTSQLGAWASQQSEVVANREQLEQQFKNTEERFRNDKVPLPDNWGGYIVHPETIEFWQGQRSRLHDRLRFTREGNDWKVERLSP